MPSLHFRLPGRAAPLGHWLASLFPGIDRSTRRRWVEDGCVRIDGRLADRPSLDCPAGAYVEIVDLPEEHLDALSSASALPTGRHTRWVGLIDDPPWPSGALRGDGQPEIEFEIAGRRDGLATILLDGPACEAETICSMLAEAGMPLVGDLERGGLGTPGGVALGLLDAAPAFEADWPEEPAWCFEMASEEGVAAAPTLRVSDETARAIRKGHAWILPDDASDPATP